jgi:hypothetical protein
VDLPELALELNLAHARRKPTAARGFQGAHDPLSMDTLKRGTTIRMLVRRDQARQIATVTPQKFLEKLRKETNLRSIV